MVQTTTEKMKGNLCIFVQSAWGNYISLANLTLFPDTKSWRLFVKSMDWPNKLTGSGNARNLFVESNIQQCCQWSFGIAQTKKMSWQLRAALNLWCLLKYSSCHRKFSAAKSLINLPVARFGRFGNQWQYIAGCALPVTAFCVCCIRWHMCCAMMMIMLIHGLVIHIECRPHIRQHIHCAHTKCRNICRANIRS